MNEEPQSIWKKSWTGWNWFRPWSIVVAATFLVILVISFFLPGGPRTFKDWLLASLVFLAASVVVATMFMGGWCFIRWLCCWKNFRRFIFGVACLVTLVALLYAEEDWRGKHDLEKFKRQWEAKGEKFDFQDFVPAPVPDDQNFAQAPIWVKSITATLGAKRARQWYGDRVVDGDTNRPDPLNWRRTMNYEEPTNGLGNWRLATLTDLKPWQDYYRTLASKTNFYPVSPRPQPPAQDVLLAVSKYDSALEQLRAAAALPGSRFPLNYDEEDKATILLPHLAALKRCMQFLQLRALAELQNGQTDQALEDIRMMFSLNHSIRTEPILISHLVRIAMLEITVQPIYEGLARHQWSEAQLMELEGGLAQFDFLADFEFSMRGERVFGISIMEYMRRTRSTELFGYMESGVHDNTMQGILMWLAPAAFFYRSELMLAQMQQRWILPMVDVTNQVVTPRKILQSNGEAERALAHGWPYNILARLTFFPISHTVEKYALAQATVDLARTAIALERCRLAQGEFPESLEALAPRFIAQVPHDVIDGGPLKYRRTSNGQFVLYSIGWNETDDGGVVVLKKGSETRAEMKLAVDTGKGDWVWRYPEK